MNPSRAITAPAAPPRSMSPTLGNETVRAFNAASGAFLHVAAAGICRTRRLMSRRGELTWPMRAQRAELDRLLALDGLPAMSFSARSPPAEAWRWLPILRPEPRRLCLLRARRYGYGCECHPSGFSPGLCAAGRQAGLQCRDRADRAQRPVRGASRRAAKRSRRELIVNAAGAWADEVAALAGVAKLGLQPKRRTAAILPRPKDLISMAGRSSALPASPAISSPNRASCWSRPAMRRRSSPRTCSPRTRHRHPVDWYRAKTTLKVERVERRWAGLRTFAPDKARSWARIPQQGFWWLAGQGGYGIMMAESLARSLAAMILEGELPEDVRALGVTAAAIGPGRFRR